MSPLFSHIDFPDNDTLKRAATQILAVAEAHGVVLMGVVATPMASGQLLATPDWFAITADDEGPSRGLRFCLNSAAREASDTVDRCIEVMVASLALSQTLGRRLEAMAEGLRDTGLMMPAEFTKVLRALMEHEVAARAAGENTDGEPPLEREEGPPSPPGL